jgi:hypothetical protein
MPKNCKLHKTRVSPLAFKATDSLNELSLQAIAQAEQDPRFKEAIVWRLHPDFHGCGDVAFFKKWFRDDTEWHRDELFRIALSSFLKPFSNNITYSSSDITFKGDWWNLPADITAGLPLNPPPFSLEI